MGRKAGFDAKSCKIVEVFVAQVLNLMYYWYRQDDKGKPVERQGRKTAGLRR